MNPTLFSDVAVIGAGPIGTVAAIALARSGAKVILLEAQPEKKKQIAGEWLHPPGLEILERLGILLAFERVNHATGHGFVIFPDDGSKPIKLRYPNRKMGMSCEHNLIVSTLRKVAANCEGIHYIPNARVTQIQGQHLSFKDLKRIETFNISSQLIVAADGRSSLAHKVLGISYKPKLISYIAGVLLEDVELPFEGFGHVFLDGPGPALVYRISDNQVRICLDVPLDFPKRNVDLWNAYSPVLPSELLARFRQVLEKKQVAWVANGYRSRIDYGLPGIALVGDATGYFHPMTATGMTVGFMDVDCFVRTQSFKKYQRQRNFGTYVPELLATTLYEVFSRDDDTVVALRRAIYQMWRQEPKECVRTMHLLSGAQLNIMHFTGSFYKVLMIAVKSVIRENVSKGQWRHLFKVLVDFNQWLRAPIFIALSRIYKKASKRRIQSHKGDKIQNRLSPK